MAAEYDLIIIGGGAVAENVADRAVQGGLSTVIVERELVGGDCSYWACMPSKTLLRSGAAVAAAKRVPGAAEAVTGTTDARATLKRRDTIVHEWSDEGQVTWLNKTGIDLVRGHGRLTGVREVTVSIPAVAGSGAPTTQRVLTARSAVVISTGSAPLLPDIPGIGTVAPWTSKDATSAHEVPASLAVIGGGVVAVELATAYASLGSAVTIVARSELLHGQEPFAAKLVTDSLLASGIKVLIGRSTTRAALNERGDTELTLDDDTVVTAAKVLVAAGRVARTMDLGLATVGLTDGDWLRVDDTMLVQGDSPALAGQWLYATGDVNHRVLLTHQGKYQARAAGDVIAARANGLPADDAPWGAHVATADHASVPQVVFSDPEVASVGLTKAAAEKAGHRIQVVDYDMSWVGGATILADDYVGQARAIIDLDREVLLGVTFVGQDVGEMLHAATVAVVGEVPITRLWHAVPSYPTMSEIWLRLLEAYGRPADHLRPAEPLRAADPLR